ncbi:uncharacterized protein LOC126900977 isoform X2 [Daktulosphaira vitifoliae]|uniref:uncharacterized protein LOC126900977 isoform X2 n=1 Tax=Daktulosphaira vitifoliae TaxID=58002 RepID=UPI0021AA4CFB|nr:uncharacterized protein LOC126900977 isoform X2 [Daktulosphaira vitifoliae]
MIYKINKVFLFIILFNLCYAINKCPTKKKVLQNIVTRLRYTNVCDVKTIKYVGSNYTILDILKIPCSYNYLYKKARLITLFLGCLYSNVMKYILYMLIQLSKYCQTIDSENDDKMYNCTLEMTTCAKATVDMISKLKGALELVDNYHTVPLFKKSVNDNYILNNAFNFYPFINDRIKDCPPSLINSKRTMSILKTSEFFFIKIGNYVNDDIKKYCDQETENLNELWSKWYTKCLIDTEEFYKYISKKINDKIEATITKKYTELGFEYNKNMETIYNFKDDFTDEIMENMELYVEDPMLSEYYEEDIIKTCPNYAKR